MTINSKMITTKELAMHIQQMRERQNAYFSSKKENRWGDKKLLAASKAKGAVVDALVKDVLAKSKVWTQVVDNKVDVPDELYPFFSTVYSELSFYSVSRKNQALTAVDIVRRSELFFSGEGHYVGLGIFVEGGVEV